jgi:hypothetical protein
MPFVAVYGAYLNKVERKGRTRAELDAVICWLTGYDAAGLEAQLKARHSLEAFFAAAPALHPARARITGKVCGVRVEEVEPPLMRLVRQLDKLVDELARGRALAQVLRA